MRLSLYIIGVILVSATVVSLIVRVPGPRPEAKTKATVELILFEIQRHEIATNGSFVPMLGPTTNSIQINRTVAAWIAVDSNVSGRVTLTPDGIVVDAWGRPLNFKLRSNEDLKISRELLNELKEGDTNDVIVWSSGANGTNEYGSGDDVFPTNVFIPSRP